MISMTGFGINLTLLFRLLLSTTTVERSNRYYNSYTTLIDIQILPDPLYFSFFPKPATRTKSYHSSGTVYNNTIRKTMGNASCTFYGPLRGERNNAFVCIQELHLSRVA